MFFTLMGGIAHFLIALLFVYDLQTRPRGQRGLGLSAGLIVLTSFISVAGIGIMWIQFYRSDAGLLNAILSTLGLPKVEWLAESQGLWPIILVSTWAGVGSQVLILFAATHQVNTDYAEAAALDGASPARIFQHIT